MRSALLAACVALCTGTAASAALVVNVTEDATGIVAQYAGSLDETGLSVVSAGGGILAELIAFETFVMIGPGTEPSRGGVTRYAIAGPLPTKPGLQLDLPRGFTSTTGSGPAWVISIDDGRFPYIGLTENFQSFGGGFVSGSSFFGDTAGVTIAASVLKEGSYVYSLANNETITLNIGNSFAQTLPTAAEVPLPAGLPLLATGAIALVALRRRGGSE